MFLVVRIGAGDLAQVQHTAGGGAVQCTEQADYAIDGHGGDSTRLRILGLIAEQPRSTQELAPLISLTEAGASRHLRLLADVGILTSHREGYYVVYSIAPDAPGEIAGIVSRPAA